MSDVEPHDLDPHALDQGVFLDQVHSFEFWFRAVEGYLAERPYGHHAETYDRDRNEQQLDGLVTTLCNYCVAETTALEGASGMIAFAPNRNAKIFLATQVVDEARHLEVFLHRLQELGVGDPEAEVERRANADLVTFKERFLQLVEVGDWDAAVLAQNVILETMEYTVFRAHANRADPITAEILEGVISDERRHFGFGENDLGRRLAAAPEERERLGEVKRELDGLVLRSLESTLADIGIAKSDQPALGRDYLNTVERLGLVS
jgi:1,2-phenylacetyl-CoA epoxidase catalytic subunit